MCLNGNDLALGVAQPDNLSKEPVPASDGLGQKMRFFASSSYVPLPARGISGRISFNTITTRNIVKLLGELGVATCRFRHNILE